MSRTSRSLPPKPMESGYNELQSLGRTTLLPAASPPPTHTHFAGRPASPAVRPRTRAGRPPSLRKHWRSILECSCRHLPRTFNPSALTAPILAWRRTLSGPTASWHARPPQHCFFHYTSSPPCQVDAFTSPRHLTARKQATKLS